MLSAWVGDTIRFARFCLGSLAFALLLIAGRLAGQEPAAMINGQALDSRPFRDSLANQFWPALAAIPCERIAWQPNVASRAAMASSTAPLRKRIHSVVGPALPPRGFVTGRLPVFRGARYTVERIQVDGRVPNVRAFAYVVHPVGLGRKSPAVVLLHGSGIHPQEAFGWKLVNAYRPTERFAHSTFIGAALEFAEAGYTVYVPWLADDRLTDYWPRLQWTSVQRSGSSLWPRVKGLSALHFLVNEVSGGADYLSTLPEVDANKLAVVGWAEGAQLAALTAAVDNRFSAIVQLSPPLDRSALRATVGGVLGGANFTHVDCALGDLETAALIAPRPLLYAYSTKDESVSRFARFLSVSVSASIRSLYAGLGRPTNFGLQADTDWSSENSARVRDWVDAALGFVPREVPKAIALRQPESEQDYQSGAEWIETAESDRQAYAASLGTCIPITLNPDITSVRAFETSVVPFRSRVRIELGLPPAPASSRFVVLQRKRLPKQEGYTLEFVRIRSTGTRLPISGLLAIPDANANHDSPAVVSVDGNVGLGRPFGLPNGEDYPYLNKYADVLAKNGTVVFVPYYPTEFPEIAAAELQAKTGGKQTSYSLMIPFVSSAMDFVLSLPQVNQASVGIWGISYGGTLALYTAAVDERFSFLVYSNPVVSADVLFEQRDSAILAAWWPEICSTLDAVQAYLIAPRRFVRENGLRDANGYERSPLESVKRIREVFESLGLESQFEFVRHNGGHETRPGDVRIFAQ